MLYLVKGRAGSGKTDFINEKMKSLLDTEDSKILLIVPEQFSFESERKMLKYLGEEKYNRIDIYSFPRLSFSVLKDNFNFTDAPSSGVRLALMHEAILALQGRLNIFKKSKASVNTLSPLVDFSKEMKYCAIKSDELISKIQLLSNDFLKEKLSEINLINETYDALVKQSYFDDTEAIDALNEYALENDYFGNKTIFIDGFRAFTKQEAATLSIMLSQAKDVYVTLCTDCDVKKNSAFSYIREYEKQLRTIASKGNVKVDEIIRQQSEKSFSSDILSLESGIFCEEKEEPSVSDGSLKIVECFNSDDECDYISGEIKRLIRSGNYRCRDIAVIERTAGTYKSRIIDRLRKLDIPVFDDSRRSLRYEALFVYIDSVLECISSGFSQESFFSYLKSGLSGFSVESISRLEKYALMWNISGNQWSEDFTMHPDGFGKEFRHKDTERLEKINELRRCSVAPLLKLKKDCKDKTGLEISALIFDFLESQNIPGRLYDLYSQLNESGYSVEANRQSVSWEVLMSILNTMSKIFQERTVSLSDWVEKFNLFVDSGDVGEIPQGLDEVKIGSADRIRTDKLKVVFLVGVNKGEFPLVSVKNGVLTDYDRASLANVGLKFNPPFEETIDEERFISYCAITAASEKLYLVYKTVGDDGVEASPSEIVADAKKCIADVEVIDSSKLPEIDLIESEEDAFSLLAKNYSTNSVIKETLIKYFEKNKGYIDRLNALNRAVGKADFTFENADLSRELFKKDMELSATKMDNYFNCPFSYFMKYGLRARALETAELDSRISGSIVHYVMEHILEKYPKASFVNVNEDEIRDYISELLKVYLEEKMGNLSEKSKRFMFLYNRVVDICFAIVERLKQEFSAGAFEPHDFELQIGGDKIPAYTLELEDGSVSVKGSIDRVDIMEIDGDKYLRVIDYKTGKKEFKLSELFSGYNLQMVLYLMALEKNGKDYYGDIIPAGVLYLPSKIGIQNYLSVRNPSQEEIDNAKRSGGKLMGMVLANPDVYKGMGVDKYPDYFPVSYTKSGDLVGNNFTKHNFRELSKMVDKNIIDMGNSLHKGEIHAYPLGKDGKPKPCSYCEYKWACGFESDDEVREIFNVKHNEALNLLGGGCDGE